MPGHQTPDEFAQEFLDERARERDEKAWQRSLQAQSYLATTPDPRSLIGFYDSDPNTKPRKLKGGGRFTRPLEPATEAEDPADQKFFNEARTRKSEFVASIENAWTDYRGEIPIEYWLTLSPVDLIAFGEGQFDGLITYLEDAQFAMGAELEIREEVRADWDRAIKAQKNRNSFITDFGGNPNYESQQDILARIRLEKRGRADELVPDEIADFMESERRILEDMRAGMKPPDSGDLKLLERLGIENEDRFYLSDGDVLSPKDHIRFFEQQVAFLEAANIKDITALDDEAFEELIAKREQFLRAELRGAPKQLKDILSPGRGMGGFEGSLAAFGGVMEKGFHYGGLVVETAWTGAGFLMNPTNGVAVLGSNLIKFFRGESEESMADTQKQVEASTGLPDPEVLARMLNMEVKNAWDTMQTEDVETFATYLSMGGGDELQAFGFFAADMKAQLTPEQQQEYYSSLAIQDNERVEQLRDSDFTVGDTVLNWLSIWGRNVPGRLSTMFSVILTDDDAQAMARENGIGGLVNTFQEIAEISETAGHTPSRQLGIDGTLTGLMLDLGGGIAWDPTTWIFGPRMMGRGVAPSTARAATTLKKSRWVRQLGDDSIMAMSSPSYGVAEIYHLLGFLDDVSMGEVMQLIDFNPQVFVKQPWRRVAGHKAVDVRIDLLDDMLDPALRIGDDLTNLADDMVKNGVKDPIVIEISRTDRSVRIVEGSKRVMAGKAADDITHLPATVNVVDDATQATVNTFVESFMQLERRVLKAEKKSSPAEWSTAERAAYDAGDWEKFSELRGYTPDEIEDFRRLLDFQEGVEPTRQVPYPEGSPNEGTLAQAADPDVIFGKQPPVAARAGTSVDDLLRDGEELGRPFEKPGKLTSSRQRPDAIFPQRMLAGIDPEDAAGIHEIIGRAIDNGRVPRGAQYTAVARGAGERIRTLARANAPGRWVERFLTPAFVGKRFELVGPHAINKIVDTLYRVFGEDTVKLNEHLGKIMAWQKKNQAKSGLAAKKLSELAPAQQRLRLLHDLKGELWDEVLDLQKLESDAAPAIAKYHELRRTVVREDAVMKAKYQAIDAETGVIGATDELNQILLEVWEDYFATYIETNSAWKGVAMRLDDGTPNWEVLRRGFAPDPQDVATKALLDDAKRVLPESVARAADQMNIPAEELAQTLFANQNAVLAFEAPSSPLDLIMAREWGGGVYTRFTHSKGVAGVREGVMAAHRLWTIDKVFTIATAATVSFDELLRIFHIGGWSSVSRWTRDRAVATEARVQALLHGKGFTKEAGSEFLSKKKVERLQDLGDYPNLLKQSERQTLEQYGLGWTDIMPGSHGYLDAAKQFSGGILQDTGFRAMMRGEDDFIKWFDGPDGERLRASTVVGIEDGAPATLYIDQATEFYKGWQTLFDDVILKPAKDAGKFKEVRAAWVEAAAKVDGASGIPKNLPGWVYEYMGPVRGVKRDMGRSVNIAKVQEAFFEKLFMDPVNYRRGFLAELVRTQERSRLTSLFESQGRRIVSDVEIEGLLGIQGLAGAQRTGLRGATQEMALKAGYIPESYVDDLVEQAVLSEIENVLYTFDSGSRLGSQARAVFPFGKPWADMAAFWGREVMRKPALRGWINDSNFLGLRSLNDAGALSFPLVPNRTSALISRLAHTDFTIDKGIIGGEGEGILHEGGLIPGSTSTDFSPLFFLPTGGDNPWSYLLPGTGILPMGFLDYYMQSRFDPITEAEDYQQLKDNISQVVPSAAFTQGGGVSRVLGGGSFAKIGGMAVDLAGMFGQDSFFNLTSQMGDITRELDRTRNISSLLSDPDELAIIMAAGSAEEADMLMQDLAKEADQRASFSHLVESAVRYMAPASTRLDNDLAEIQGVWLEALQFEELAFVGQRRGRDPDIKNMSAEDLRALANDVRTFFFRLEPYQRDILVVQQPSLAVNMVGSFEWTPQAINRNIEGTSGSYRTGGTKKELALHESLVKEGLVRPVQPIVRERRILGVIDAAKKSAAKELYVETVRTINEELWEFGTSQNEEVVGFLQGVIDSEFGRERDLRTVKEVWFNWNSIEEDLEIWQAGVQGIDPVRGETDLKEDETAFDRLRAFIQIPDKLKPWGSTFPGLEEENITQDFNQFELTVINPKQRALADALGIDIQVGTSGEELFQQVQQVAVQRDNYVYDVVREDYDRYILNRANRSGVNMMHEAAQSDLISPEFQEHIKNFLFIDGLMGDRYDDERFVPLQDQIKMREMFLFLLQGSKLKPGVVAKDKDGNVPPGVRGQKTNWDFIWESQYERKYGPLTWIPPEPKSPFDENGDVAGPTLVPSIRHVVDGDTIMVQEHPGSKVLVAIRLLGVDAPEVGGPDPEGAKRYQDNLEEALMQALENGDNIYFVQDDRFGKTDQYGRILAWMWIGDRPFYNVNDLLPHRDVSGESEE